MAEFIWSAFFMIMGFAFGYSVCLARNDVAIAYYELRKAGK